MGKGGFSALALLTAGAGSVCGGDHPLCCRLSSGSPGPCALDVSSIPPTHTPVMPIKAVSRLYQRPLGDKTTLLGNHCVRLWPLPQVACSHHTIVPHPHAAFSGSPVSATKTHGLGLALEASHPHPQPPDCRDFSKNHLCSSRTWEGAA